MNQKPQVDDDLDGLLSDSAQGSEHAFKIAAPVMDSEQLRTAVESITERRTKDGKVYGVKLDTRGRITAKQRLFASLIVQGRLNPLPSVLQNPVFQKYELTHGRDHASGTKYPLEFLSMVSRG